MSSAIIWQIKIEYEVIETGSQIFKCLTRYTFSMILPYKIEPSNIVVGR